MIELDETARVLAQALGCDGIDPDADFFRNGGDSVRAMLAVARLMQRAETLGAGTQELEGRLINAIFEEGTARAMARVLADALPAADDEPPRLAPVERTGTLAASYAQARLWIPTRLAPLSAAYNIVALRRVGGAFSEEALAAAVRALVERHEALRTRLVPLRGEPVQRVLEDSAVEWAVHDLSGAPQAGRAAAREWCAALARRPFDPAEDPPVRVGVCRLGEEDRLVALVLSHLVADGWSMALVFRELSELYAAALETRPPALDPLPVQYGDFSVWQRRWLEGGALDRQLAYWRARLDGAPEVLELAPATPRPQASSPDGGVSVVRFGRERRAAAQTFAAARRTTPNVVWLAAFKALLHRYTGREDLVVGSPFAGRTRPALEGVVGFFTNTLLLRTRVAPGASFNELVEAVRHTVSEAAQHQDVPLEAVLAALRPRRDLSWTPYLQVMFVFQNTPWARLHFEGAEVEEVPLHTGAAKFDLTAELVESENEMECRLEYRADRLDERWVRGFGARLGVLLDRALESPDTPLVDLEILAPSERAGVMGPSLSVSPDLDDPWQAFLRRARATPDADAVREEGRAHTFAELRECAEALAQELEQAGVRPGQVVALAGGRGFQAVAGILAALRLGAAWCPLPGGPRERVAKVLAHVRPAAVLGGAGDAGAAAEPAILPPEVAYVMYTSGSTGEPRGVLATRAGMMARLRWMWLAYPFQPGEVSCHRVPLTFVDSVWDVLGPLLAGVPLAVTPRKAETDVGRLVAFLAVSKATRVTLVPSLLRALLERLEAAGETLPALSLWICSGEPLPPALAAAFHARLPGRTLLNLYGCTECSGDSTVSVVQPSSRGRVPAGRPIAGAEVHVLDARGRPTIPGTVGEVYLGGAGVALGYLDNSAETARRFVPAPQGTGARGPLFRTYDLGRVREDGELELLGRADGEVSVRGFRLDTGEVRNALLAHPAVRDAVVVPFEDAVGEARLAAYVVARDGAPSPDPAVLRRYLAVRLPRPMVPRFLCLLERIPLNTHGKVDRTALPPPDRSSGGKAPRNRTEREVAEIWEFVVEGGTPGVEEDFFDRGGDSMDANRVLARVHARFDVEVPLSEFYREPTVAALARRILEAEVAAAAPDALREALAAVRAAALPGAPP